MRSTKVITLALLSSAIFLEGCNKKPKKTVNSNPYDATSGAVSQVSSGMSGGSSPMPWYMFWGGGSSYDNDYDRDRRHYGSSSHSNAHGLLANKHVPPIAPKSIPATAAAPVSGASKSVSSSVGSSSRGGFGGIGGGMGASS